MRSNHLRMRLERSLASIFDHAGKARFAASIAWRVSASPKSGTRVITSPVALLVTASLGSPTHWPPT